ncbi:hypothetical protein N8I74_11105 [Chitiniphilus purpureus]|uniref:DUF6950 domain-containing protein n=1 Tax=Chitiniphilus purpureus TaxID=2981137 RepID=A0ABY6DHP4_9NEIS|nr:hypothetical protein [Chitiniphilus sp. CD1]UXY13870.1 hypothetical protein N8I74_11105 [Chitiniphilus sp. CD1]
MNRHFVAELANFAAAERGRPYQFPDTVCLALALRGLDHAQGGDLFARHAKHFKSPAAMRRFLGRGNPLDRVFARAAECGLVEVDPRYFQPGDILFAGTPPFGVGAALVISGRALSSHPDSGVQLLQVADHQAVRALRLQRG